MRPDRTTPFLVILALIGALIVGLTVGGAGPLTWLRALGGGAAPEEEAVRPTPTARPSATVTATEEATARPSATPRPTRTPTPEATATAEPTAEPTAAPTESPEPTPEPPAPTEAPPEPAPSPVTLAATTLSPVNFREAPSSEGTLIASLGGGAPLTLLGRNASATWLRARLEDGREGWLTSAPTIVAVEGDIQTLPVVE